MFFLRGITNGLPACIRQQALGAELGGSVSAALKGIAELDAASRDTSGLQMSSTDLQIIRAGGFVALARREILESNYTQAEDAMATARHAYNDVPRQPALTASQTVKLVVGLIRTGAPVDGVALLARLPANDPQRYYMMAEAFFSLGDRMGAAEQYSKWIALGCSSKPFMLSLDEYGEQRWAYLQRKGSGHTGPCGALPQELRSRLEALKLETPYLARLPEKNDAPVPFPATADR
jgi:hypothetical protein